MPLILMTSADAAVPSSEVCRALATLDSFFDWLVNAPMESLPSYTLEQTLLASHLVWRRDLSGPLAGLLYPDDGCIAKAYTLRASKAVIPPLMIKRDPKTNRLVYAI